MPLLSLSAVLARLRPSIASSATLDGPPSRCHMCSQSTAHAALGARAQHPPLFVNAKCSDVLSRPPPGLIVL